MPVSSHLSLSQRLASIHLDLSQTHAVRVHTSSRSRAIAASSGSSAARTIRQSVVEIQIALIVKEGRVAPQSQP